MYQIDIRDNNSVYTETVYNIYDYPTLPKARYVKGKSKMFVDNIILTFDIETSRYTSGDTPASYMYQWQFGINANIIFGRTWKEFLHFLRDLSNKLPKNAYTVCYVHFLSYEYQFIRDFIEFDDVFATKEHKILFCRWRNIEFRCSFLLSNMSLEKWTTLCNTKYKKSKEYFDYNIQRTPNTELSALEKQYCFIDVYSLYECICVKLAEDNDNIATIPYTSTGYVRRHAKSYLAQKSQNWEWFNKSEITLRQYDMLKLLFRGGNVAANRFIISHVINNVHSYDKKSSYPYQMYSKTFPYGVFMLASKNITIKDILQDVDSAYMTTITLHDLRLKTTVPIPYLSYSKCWLEGKYTNINGRITQADMLTTSICEIDLAIITSQYSFSRYTIGETYRALKKALPDELIDSMLVWFDKKCHLSNDESSEEYYYYMKSKNSLNSYFGMFVSDIIHEMLIDNYRANINDKSVKMWISELGTPPAVQLHKYYNSRNNFLPYQVGVWITAYARKELQDIIDITGLDTMYVDTDCDKFINDIYFKDIENLNTDIIANSYSVTVDGRTQTLGVWERERDISFFKTLGAKKYYCEYPDGKRKITVSGLSKSKSLNVIKSVDDFEIGKVIDCDNSGRTTSYYNNRGIHYVYIGDERILSASNIGVEPTTYTLGISNELDKILRMLGVLDE